MDESAQNNFTKGLVLIPKIGCFIVALLSILVLIGWTLDLSFFKSILPGLAPMNPIEAVVFAFSGLALFLRLEQEELSPSRFLSVNILSFLILLTGLITLLRVFWGVNLGLDTLLFRAKVGGDLIAPNTGLNFILLGIALMAFKKNLQNLKITQFFTLCAGIITMFAGIGYLYSALSFYQFSKFSPMPLNSACAFALLCFCLLLSTRNKGVMKILTQNLEVSTLSRRLMLSAITLPILLGGLRTLAQGFFDTQTGTALMVISQIIIFTVIIWLTTNLLYQEELNKQLMNKDLEEKTNQLEETDKELAQKVIELEKAKKKIQDLLEHENKLQEINSSEE